MPTSLGPPNRRCQRLTYLPLSRPWPSCFLSFGVPSIVRASSISLGLLRLLFCSVCVVVQITPSLALILSDQGTISNTLVKRRPAAWSLSGCTSMALRGGRVVPSGYALFPLFYCVYV